MSGDSRSWNRHSESDTRIPEDQVAELGDDVVPSLTVLCHPNPGKVGEVAVLTGLRSPGGEVLLSRLEPHFALPGGGTSHHLSDPYVSRKPVRLISRPGCGVRLDAGETSTEVTVAGERLTGTRDLGPDDLELGVVVLLGRGIALLLHLRPLVSPRPPSFGLVGESVAMVGLREEIEFLAKLDHAVLLRGESGTGKELVARALHDAGPRGPRPFVPVNAGAIPASLAGAELFGHDKGAFTGAGQRRSGYFQRAHGGTLFLDEIGAASDDVQVMLLRVLESCRVQPVGATDSVSVDVRLISATDADLEAAMANGRLRSPLFYRLSSYKIELPPLRARRDDVGRLFFHFLRQELEALGEASRLASERAGSDPWVPAELVGRLAVYTWPGNVRELRNVVRQLAVASRGGPILRIPPEVERFLSDSPGPRPRPPASHAPATPTSSYRHPDEVGEEELRKSLREHRWVVGDTAAALNVSRTSLYSLMKKAGIRKASDLSREEIENARRHCDGKLNAMIELLEVSKRGLRLRMTELGL